MLEIAFQYDPTQEKWVRCVSKEYVQQEIERIPCVLVMKYENDGYDRNLEFFEERYVCCPKHYQQEKVTEVRRNYVTSANGCVFEGLVSTGTMVLNAYGYSPPVVYVPFRWRIFQKEASGPINIAADVAEVPPYRKSTRMIWRNFSVSVHMGKRRMVLSKLQGANSKDWMADTHVEIPEIVVETAMEALRESTKAVTGIKPSVLSQMKGNACITAYIERPFDLNIVFLKPFLREYIGKNFDEIFPYDCKDNYRKLCQLLDINPPKSLRKAYSYNPYAIVWYMLFQYWRIKDINLMQKFFYLDECVADVSLKKLYITSDEPKWIECLGDCSQEWNAMNRYCVWRLSQEGEKKFLHWLYQVSSADVLQSWQRDIINAFYDHESALSDGIKHILLRDGLTQYVHDQISWEVNVYSKGLGDVQISYEPSILAYQCIINGYEFCLVQDTHTLRHVGLTLQNCVATYRKAVIDHRSIIVAVRHGEKYVACIEIQPERGIVQALGSRNQQLDGEVLLVCRYWAKMEKLHVDTDHLDFPDTSQNLFDLEPATVEVIPYQKTIEETDATELLAMDEDDSQPGYYRKLGIQLLRGPKQNISAPPWMHFQDEQAYLTYVFPQGQRIYDAAFKGNTEAQMVLGMMYCCGGMFRRDTEKTLIWFSKAAQNGDKSAQEEMEKLKKCLGDEMTEKDFETLWGLSRIQHLMQEEECTA